MAGVNKCIPLFYMDVIIYPCHNPGADLANVRLVKEDTGSSQK